MQLIKAFRYSQGSSLAFVGAGGKSTALFRAARELAQGASQEGSHNTILATTTTHLGSWQSSLADHFYNIKSISEIEKLADNLPGGIVLVIGGEINNRLGGLTPQLLGSVRELAEERSLPLLIEADGSHTRPLKAPGINEPAIPDFVQNVVVVAGLLGLGKPLTKEWVHRPEIFAELSGLYSNEVVTADALARVLLHNEGGLKNIPPKARKIVLLNQADDPLLQSQAKAIAEQLIPAYHVAVIASLSPDNNGSLNLSDSKDGFQDGIHAVVEQIGGIVLAAGKSSRFGKPKQLLPWKGKPLIRHVVQVALDAGLSPVVVVVGASAPEVQSAINDLPVRIVNNISWAQGVSSSIHDGIEALPKELGGAVFLQADQPQIPPALIRSLVEVHQTTLNPIIAPQIDGQRGNPVLFDACTFPKLQAIDGDMGGRALFGQFQVGWVPWHDPNLMMDIDSPEDYLTFLRAYPGEEGQE